MRPSIDIICPNCSKRAGFFSEQVRYGVQLVPGIEGHAVCKHCGFNKAMTFSPEQYWYRVPVEDRYLYARNAHEATVLMEFFRSGKKVNGPERDFPASFHRNKAHIVEALSAILKKEGVEPEA